MQYFYVTGTSRGLGRALYEILVQDDDAFVFGIARGDGPKHPQYRHTTLDLADVAAVSAFRFEPLPDATRIVLVNNAAVMSMIHIGSASPETIANTFAVNAVAPAILTNAFVATYASTGADLVVCNLMTGGVRNAVDGGALYGGSKAALDYMTRVGAEEARVVGRGSLRFMSIMPGSLDTEMQEQLRALDPADYPLASTFRARYEAGQLLPPDQVAARIRKVLLNPALAPDTVLNLSDLPA
jgi:benzil reductase ((S)-benzoin forming)